MQLFPEVLPDVSGMILPATTPAAYSIPWPFFWGSVGLPIATGLSKSKPMKVRAAWDHSDLGTFTGSFATIVAPHDTALLRLSPIE